jgi:hypothetical protein
VAVTEASHGFETGFENGSAVEELRRRCAWLHHGQVATDLPTMIRARWQNSPLIIVPTTTSVAAVLGACQGAAWMLPGQSDGRP